MKGIFEGALLWLVHWLLSPDGTAALTVLEADLLAAMDNNPTSAPTSAPTPTPTSTTAFNPKASSVPEAVTQ